MITEEEVCARLICNDALFENIFVFQQKFDIIPNREHIGASIAYQDIQELREDFLVELVDTVADWVYSAKKFEEMKEAFSAHKTERAAAAEVIRKAKGKFRVGHKGKMLSQGQIGELLLFHFIQRAFAAVPILRKMPITTSPELERFGADAIHYKFQDGRHHIILGEAKAYTSKYKFNEAMENAISSILSSYKHLRKELHLYLHEDFLDPEMDKIAEMFLSKKLNPVEVDLVCLILYNELNKIAITDEEDIKGQIKHIIEKRYEEYANSKIDLRHNPILSRITYIVFPVWKFDELAKAFEKQMGE